MAQLDVRAGHRRDAHRHLLPRLFDPRRGDDGGVLEPHQPQGDGRQLHRIAGNRDAVHRRLPEAAQEHRNRVDAGKQAGEREPALRVRLRLPWRAGPAAQSNRRAGQHAARRVDDDARDLPGLRRGGAGAPPAMQKRTRPTSPWRRDVSARALGAVSHRNAANLPRVRGVASVELRGRAPRRTKTGESPALTRCGSRGLLGNATVVQPSSAKQRGFRQRASPRRMQRGSLPRAAGPGSLRCRGALGAHL